MNKILTRFLKNPIELTKNLIRKTILLPLKYSHQNDYDAARYWDDRLRKYDGNVKSVGIEGLSEEENVKQRTLAREVFLKVIENKIKNFDQISVLEIGCGTGFYTQILADLGVKDYVALDITDAHFRKLKKRFPEYIFTKKDIATVTHRGQYNLIIMMDVIEHIVTDVKFQFALNNVITNLKDGGIFLIVPLYEVSKRHLFHVRLWSMDELTAYFSEDFQIEKTLARENEYLISVIKNK